MTSVRSCYCKHEKNAARKKDNDITIHNGNRRPATAVCKKSIVTSRICGNGRESCKRARCVTNEETPNTNRSVEAQPSNPILSPETSIALENAEKIINNAKIQLMEVCATSSFNSAQRSKNTYLDEPPLDDEAEERSYVRELVATKFHDTCSSRLSETTGKASEHSEKHDSPSATVRRIDLSAPKFRVSRRRHADWSSLGYGSDDQSRGRASPARVPLRDSMGVANGSTARDNCARERRRTLSARGNTCGIQKGPSVHIVDRELTRQDLEDVHISPESSRAQSHANVATYTLHHDVIQNANDPEVMPTTRRVRLDTLQREKPIGRLIIEAVTETVPMNPASKSEKDLEKFTNSESEKNDGRNESLKRENQNPEPQNAGEHPNACTGTSECLKNATNQGAKCAVIATPRTDRNEKLQNKARNEKHEGIASGDTEIRYAQDGGIFSGRSAAGRLRNDENIVDKIQPEEKQGARSKSSLAGDTSRKTAFPRCENITCREAESPTPYRTIDGHLSHTFNRHNEQNGLGNVARRTFSLDASREEDDLDEVDLYQPCLDDLDSILHSNDRKIERVVRTTRNLSALLSDPEFAIYKLDEDERVPQDANHEKLYQDLLTDKDNKLNESARSSILETELRNEDLTISEIQRNDDDPKGINTAATKSSTRDHSRSRSNYSKNSVESSVFPASDASDDPRTSRDSDRTQESAVKARFADSSIDRSDVTTFSNLVPALSSTHTEPQCRLREEEIVPNDRHADAKSRVTSTSKLSKREICRSGKKYADNGILPQLLQKDAFQTDRFVAYILQDEKQSLEGKIASALKESAITPATVQKLLDHLSEAESIRDARQTETLDILRNILINIKSQSDQGNMNDKETSSRNIPDSTAGPKISPIVIDELTSQGEEAQQTRAKIDANKMERVNKNSYELKSPGGHSLDFSEYREKRESVRSTARFASTQNYENNIKRDAGQTKSAEVAETVSIDAKNQTANKSVNENSPEKMTLSQNVAGSLIRTDATSNAIEKTILRTEAKNNTSDTGLIADKFKDSKKPDKYFSVSPAFPETRESVRSAVHFEFARGSKNNSKNNSKGNSASEAESLKQISDIRSDDDDENPRENPEYLSTKIASAESRQKREIEAADSVTAIAVSENKRDDINNEKLGEDKSIDANKNQCANKITTQTKQVTESDIPEEAIKEIKSEKIHDIITPVRVLFALSEVSEIKDEQVRSDASPVRSKFIDKIPRKTEVDFVQSSTKEDTGSLHETEINSRQIVLKEKIDPVDNCSADPPRDCIVKNSESSLQEFPSRDKQISLDIGEDNFIRDMRNEEISKSMTFAAIENRKDRNESSRLQKTARSDNKRQSIDLTERLRNYKIDVLSSSNSSVSSLLLDERSTNGMSSANARRIGITPETSHSEGELYMPSSCSYSLGEVRVLRRRRDLIEDNGLDRDSSVTVLVTRSMLTSLNDSTMSLLESSERV